MTRTRVRWDRILVLLVLLLGLLALAGRAFGGSQPPAPLSTARYEVQPGDTLWGIARLQVGATEDPRPMVDQLRRLNGVDPGALAPGTRLLVPAV